jgi:16S rRNA (guanine966-N2)-methyltransferase
VTVADAGRVIAGSARGVRLEAAGGATRPLTDRVKEALFGILEGATLGPWPTSFLDLYAGSGAAGIEALSRGAPRATFVERDRAALRAIATNLSRCGFVERALLVPGEVGRFLAREPGPAGGPFGAVFLDPPYGDATLEASLARLAGAAQGWLVEDAVVVAKHFWRDRPQAPAGDLVLARERRFGETMLTFYRRAA